MSDYERHLYLHGEEAEFVRLATDFYYKDLALAGDHGVSVRGIDPIAGVCAAYINIRQAALSKEASSLLSGCLVLSIVDPALCLRPFVDEAETASARARITEIVDQLNSVHVWAIEQTANNLLQKQRKESHGG